MFILTVDRNKFFTLECLLKIGVILVVSAAICFGFVFRVYGEQLAALTSSLNAEPAKTVIIDAGHGGEDGGTVGKNGVLEKDINLSVVFYLGENFANQGYTVIFTRTEDKLLYTDEENIKGIRKISDLKNRCKVAEKYPDALFISIHMNSFGDERFSGLQVYYDPQSKDSLLLADSIQSTVRDKLQPENKRVVKPGGEIYLLKNTPNISVLVECGFLSNAEECEKLSQKEYQKRLSFEIFCGIIDYVEKSDEK